MDKAMDHLSSEKKDFYKGSNNLKVERLSREDIVQPRTEKSTSTLENIVEEAYKLKLKKVCIEARLKILYEAIRNEAIFEDRKKTAVINTNNSYIAKVQKQEKYKFDSNKLSIIKQDLDLFEFNRMFKKEYKLYSKQFFDDFIKSAPLKLAKKMYKAFEIQQFYTVNIIKKN